MTYPATVTGIMAKDLAQFVEKSQVLSAIPWLRHGVTRRVPGLGLAEGNVGYTAPRDERDAWQMRQQWARAMSIDPANLVRVRQVHGNDVRVATIEDTERGTHPDATEAPVADALITGEPGVALMTLHADCLAMFLVDPTHRAVAAVHAGWRSTVADIAGRTVHAMRETFATRPEDLIAYVGPSIGAERYEVGDEVIDAWRAIGDLSAQVCHQIEGHWRFDLKAANRAQLVANGLKPEHIEVSGVCTASDPDRWFSHRAQGPLTGRSAAIIAIAGGNQ